MDLFQMYMAWCYDPVNKQLVRDTETHYSGRVNSYEETELRFYVIYYLMYKYYSSMNYPVDFKEVCPKIHHKKISIIKATQFEELFIHSIAENNLYRDTVLEMVDNYGHTFTNSLLNELFYGYCRIEEWNGMSSRSMYRNILRLDSQGRAEDNRLTPLPVAGYATQKV
jgi:hypothetical protein